MVLLKILSWAFFGMELLFLFISIVFQTKELIPSMLKAVVAVGILQQAIFYLEG